MRMTSPTRRSRTDSEQRVGAVRSAGTSANPAECDPRRLLSLNRMAGSLKTKMRRARQAGRRVGKPATGDISKIIREARGAQDIDSDYARMKMTPQKDKLAGHIKAAHGGMKDKNCNACRELSA